MYLLQLLLDLHGPQDDGTADRVLDPLHVGVQGVQGEHFPAARDPVHRFFRHVFLWNERRAVFWNTKEDGGMKRNTLLRVYVSKVLLDFTSRSAEIPKWPEVPTFTFPPLSALN